MPTVSQRGELLWREYTDRNILAAEELDALFKSRFGITHAEMNFRFLGNLDRDIRILEVGTGAGNELIHLQNMGFKNLWGIEQLDYAVALAKSRTRNIDIIEGSALDLPYGGGSFDLVFTSGLLIHIDPKDIMRVMGEIYRCTKKYIWCYEYYADTYTPIEYRGHSDLLWKADFAQLFLRRFNNLTLIKEGRLEYLHDDNIDTMFLLQKENGT